MTSIEMFRLLNPRFPISISVGDTWEGRPVERISIDDLSHWKGVVDSRIKNHPDEKDDRNSLLILAVVVFSLAILVLGFLAIVMIPYPLLMIPAYFLLSASLLVLSYLIDRGERDGTYTREALKKYQTILKSEKEFSQFASIYKKEASAPKVTEEQFMQALELYSKGVDKLNGQDILEVEAMKSEFVWQ